MTFTIYLQLVIASSIVSLLQAGGNQAKQIKPAMIPEVNMVKAGRGTVPVNAGYVLPGSPSSSKIIS